MTLIGKIFLHSALFWVLSFHLETELPGLVVFSGVVSILFPLVLLFFVDTFYDWFDDAWLFSEVPDYRRSDVPRVGEPITRLGSPLVIDKRKNPCPHCSTGECLNQERSHVAQNAKGDSYLLLLNYKVCQCSSCKRITLQQDAVRALDSYRKDIRKPKDDTILS